MKKTKSLFAGLVILSGLNIYAQTTIPPQGYIQPAAVPAAIALPAGQVSLLRVHGEGWQIYTCTMVAGAPAWSLVGPNASLFNYRQGQLGIHFAGPGSLTTPTPEWQLIDGSGVVGAKVASAPSPDPTAVSWLLLTVASHFGSSGFLSNITTIQRVNTVGGIAPTAGCDATSQGIMSQVPYSADYYFSM